MSRYVETEQAILQPLVISCLCHVNIHDAFSIRAFHVEVHSEVCSPKPICLHLVRERPSSGPFACCRLSISHDLPNWSQQGSTFRGGFDAVDGMIELDSLAICGEKFLVEEVGHEALVESVLTRPFMKPTYSSAQASCHERHVKCLLRCPSSLFPCAQLTPVIATVIASHGDGSSTCSFA